MEAEMGTGMSYTYVRSLRKSLIVCFKQGRSNYGAAIGATSPGSKNQGARK
jgi:hypothetical protein